MQPEPKALHTGMTATGVYGSDAPGSESPLVEITANIITGLAIAQRVIVTQGGARRVSPEVSISAIRP